MKVLLLSLPGIEERDGDLFPLGLGYLASALQANHQVRAHHYPTMAAARAEAAKIAVSFQPDLVGGGDCWIRTG